MTPSVGSATAGPAGLGGAAQGPPRPITRPYLLLTHIPGYRGRDGALWLERLWHRDLVAHLRYLHRMVLACPVRPVEAGEGLDLVRVDVPPGVSFEVVPIPELRSLRDVATRVPRVAARLWGALDHVDVVHAGVAGWPIPIGWVGHGLALARRKRRVVVVESAPWRLTEGGPRGPKAQLRAAVSEALARFFVQRAHVRVFTQDDYRRTLAGHKEAGHVTPASWIEERDVLGRDAAEAAWAAKRGRRVRLLFAARLVASKGVYVLLDALERLEARAVDVDVEVLGDGPAREGLERLAARLGRVRLDVRDPVAYGEPFFTRLRRAHAVLIPSLGDEQPRVLFDAYAQAVPVIASDTDGLRPYVRPGETGWLVPTAAPEALADAMARAAGDRASLERLGLEALVEAERFTLRGMHAARWRILDAAFG